MQLDDLPLLPPIGIKRSISQPSNQREKLLKGLAAIQASSAATTSTTPVQQQQQLQQTFTNNNNSTLLNISANNAANNISDRAENST